MNCLVALQIVVNILGCKYIRAVIKRTTIIAYIRKD
jgi:hypothetical protein